MFFYHLVLRGFHPIFASVRKLLSIFFIAIVLSSSTELGQFLRFPILLWHFQEHQNKDKDISFVDFLRLHYEINDGEKEFDPKDSSLPFKSCQYAVAAHFVALPPTRICIPPKPIISFSVNTPLFDDGQFHSSYLSAVWQPPKSC